MTVPVPVAPCAIGPGVSEEVADQVVAYLGAGLAALGALPTRDRIVIERVFDESEGTQLIVHSPYGGRINRALGLALRKRFCVSFDFELQAAADDDTVVLSLGPQHSFPLPDVPKMLPSRSAVEALTQAVLPHPMLASRWRWNLTRALVVPRSLGGKRQPIHLQRMESDDLLAATWPALAACQENAAPGPVPVPDHVLVRQTVRDCLTEPMDAEGLVDLLEGLESGRVSVHCVESAEPSPLSHGILTGRPFTFLDGAPLEERRTRAVNVPRGLGPLGADGLPPGLPVTPGELAPFDPQATADVLEQVRPRPRSADELHDLLLTLVLTRPVTAWSHWFDELERDGRAHLSGGSWAGTERLELAESIVCSADDPLVDADDALAECLGGHLALAGPVTVDELVAEAPLPCGSVRGVPVTVARARSGLARLEAAGSAIALPDGRWCARHLLVRLHAASRNQRRRHIEPASVSDLIRFLACWQHVADGTRTEGRSGLLRVIEQLQGIEVAAGEWERQVLPARVAGYDPRWLDELCLSGEVAWARLTPRADAADDGDAPVHRGSSTPSSATPLALVTRVDLPWMLGAVRADRNPIDPTVGASADILAVLRSRGSVFPLRADHWSATPRRRDRRGTVGPGVEGHRDGGCLLGRAAPVGHPQTTAGPGRVATRRMALGRQRAEVGSGVGEGRWSMLPDADLSATDGGGGPVAEELAEAVAFQLLARWGIVAWEVWSRESYRVPWRDVVRALRRMEARGQVLGGRFVAGVSGEQYAAPEAAALLAEVRRDPTKGADVTVAGADPLNLTGTLLPGPRVPSVRHRSIRYVAGSPVLPVLADAAS